MDQGDLEPLIKLNITKSGTTQSPNAIQWKVHCATFDVSGLKQTMEVKSNQAFITKGQFTENRRNMLNTTTKMQSSASECGKFYMRNIWFLQQTNGIK